jgi:arylformamidase
MQPTQSIPPMSMKGYRAIELSHDLLSGKELYKLDVTNRPVDEMEPGYPHPPDVWYIMSEVHFWSHVGTHMESPYHYIKDGPDISQIPLTQVVGECALIDCSDRGVAEPITLLDLQTRGAHVRAGDIVFIRTGLSHNYRTPHSRERPYMAQDAVRWLVEEKSIACLGVDCSGIEKRGEPHQPNHEMLFAHGIPLIEHLAYLEELPVDRFLVVAVPWRVHRLEASPVSVVAFIPDAL